MKSHNQNQRKVCLCLLSGLLFFMISILSLFSAYAEDNDYRLTLHCEAENNQQTKIIANDEFAIVQIADVDIIVGCLDVKNGVGGHRQLE